MHTLQGMLFGLPISPDRTCCVYLWFVRYIMAGVLFESLQNILPVSQIVALGPRTKY